MIEYGMKEGRANSMYLGSLSYFAQPSYQAVHFQPLWVNKTIPKEKGNWVCIDDFSSTL